MTGVDRERLAVAEVARLDRFGPPATIAAPDVVADLRTAQSWPELFRRLRERGLSLRADAGGVKLFRVENGARVDLPHEGADAVGLVARLGVPPGEALLLGALSAAAGLASGPPAEQPR